MNKIIIIVAIAVLLIGAFLSQSIFIQNDDSKEYYGTVTPIQSVVYESTLGSAIQPLPLKIDLDIDKVSLGERLFHDVQLSVDDSISCANCHGLTMAGTIAEDRAKGVDGQLGKRNPPTVFNSGYNAFQHWDRRFDTLEEQVSGPILNPVEMNSSWPLVLEKLQRDSDYRQLFSNIYPEGITQNSVENAIATFERSLITPNSPFDRFLRGETEALTLDQKDGYQLFRSLGCISCHQGINIGGNLLQKIGLFSGYVNSNSTANIDLGRFDITGREEDKFVFKVPSLRNVAKTAPYFHDGSVATLEEAIRLMAQYQLGRDISSDEVVKIRVFLESLTGTYKGEPL